MAEDGGPVQRLATQAIAAQNGGGYQACAWLRDGLCPVSGPRGLFSDAAGTGTHRSPMVARHMAVSESLERWAHQVRATETSPGCGFAHDPSSNGMAAYPGPTSRAVQAKARMEAVERHSLFAWWEQRSACHFAPTRWPGVWALELAPIAPDCAVVVLTKETGTGYHAYGYGAARRLPDACDRAHVEMTRHEIALRHRLGQLAAGTVTPLAGIFEQRAWFFATPEGHAAFLAAIRRSSPSRAPRLPKLVFDGEVCGPWSVYAKVWRTTYTLPSDRVFSADPHYFFW